jgi:hypothetical protein|uniref:Uncharacterized protein n=1 Tax=viral metagenome TaxID=1070528 RepID=A0A6C0BIR6_9ZZZZ
MAPLKPIEVDQFAAEIDRTINAFSVEITKIVDDIHSPQDCEKAYDKCKSIEEYMRKAATDLNKHMCCCNSRNIGDPTVSRPARTYLALLNKTNMDTIFFLRKIQEKEKTLKNSEHKRKISEIEQNLSFWGQKLRILNKAVKNLSQPNRYLIIKLRSICDGYETQLDASGVHEFAEIDSDDLYLTIFNIRETLEALELLIPASNEVETSD